MLFLNYVYEACIAAIKYGWAVFDIIIVACSITLMWWLAWMIALSRQGFLRDILGLPGLGEANDAQFRQKDNMVAKDFQLQKQQPQVNAQEYVDFNSSHSTNQQKS
eukprot:TRINITY_DN11278_c0_g2_i3.p4 TRINITY_DN11278_c0_g2~~TRINITY_DN11278_c0_g2_i3.p4  ORF type:complete len:106 (+),score=5.92 TRINITY_DN11278_c0_g2_i3:183-500(+)